MRSLYLVGYVFPFFKQHDLLEVHLKHVSHKNKNKKNLNCRLPEDASVWALNIVDQESLNKTYANQLNKSSMECVSSTVQLNHVACIQLEQSLERVFYGKLEIRTSTSEMTVAGSLLIPFWSEV